MSELRQREPSIEIPVLRELVRGAPCTFRIPGVCRGDYETTCWCHSNEQRHGKGVGKKAHDLFGAIGCKECHDWYDLESRRLHSVVYLPGRRNGRVAFAEQEHERNEERRRAFDEAHIRSMIWLYLCGHLKFIK